MSELPRPSKPVSASRTEQVHIVMPADVNGSYTLFGGILMQWIDVVAGVVSRRHSGMETRTAAVDHLEFLAPAHINDTVTLQGRVTYVAIPAWRCAWTPTWSIWNAPTTAAVSTAPT